MSWQEEDADGNRQGLTIAEFGEPGGPGMGGCPAGPLQSGPVGPTNLAVNRSGATAAGELDAGGRRARHPRHHRLRGRGPGAARERRAADHRQARRRRRRQQGDDRRAARGYGLRRRDRLDQFRRPHHARGHRGQGRAGLGPACRADRDAAGRHLCNRAERHSRQRRGREHLLHHRRHRPVQHRGRGPHRHALRAADRGPGDGDDQGRRGRHVRQCHQHRRPRLSDRRRGVSRHRACPPSRASPRATGPPRSTSPRRRPDRPPRPSS